MPFFEYTARNTAGEVRRGVQEAESLSDFYKKLDSLGFYCTAYTERERGQISIKTVYKLKMKELVLLCRKMATMLSAGMNITNCLDVLAATADHPKAAKLFLLVYESIKGGAPLSVAMREQGNSFPLLLCNMVESGEESGNLDGVFNKLAEYYTKQEKVQKKINTASIYPKILAFVAGGVVLILFTFVLPSMFQMFGQQELPLITKIMMQVSGFLTQFWYLVILFCIIVYVVGSVIGRMPFVQMLVDRMLVTFPKVGQLMRKIYSGRFCSALALLYASGLSLLSSMRLAVNVVGNHYIGKELEAVNEKVSSGMPLSSSIEEANVFDKLMPSMIQIGEETGSLDSILNSAAEYYDGETETAIESLLAIMEPALLVFMALVIGTIMVAVMLPIYQGYQTVGQ